MLVGKISAMLQTRDINYPRLGFKFLNSLLKNIFFVCQMFTLPLGG